MKPSRVVPLGALVLGSLLLLPLDSDAVPRPAVAPPSSWNLTHKCTYCHDIHGGPEDPDLQASDVEVLCLTCHGPAGPASLKATPHEGATCLDCHDLHRDVTNWLGGLNRKMVGRLDPLSGLAVIRTPQHGMRDVVFESLGSQAGEPGLHSFADDDEDGNLVWDGACEVCHAVEAGGPALENHESGQTCTVCHAHVEGFARP